MAENVVRDKKLEEYKNENYYFLWLSDKWHFPYNWRAECKTMLSDDLKCFSFFWKSAWNFVCRFQLNRNTSPCIFFGCFALRFQEVTYAKSPQFSKRHLLLNKEQKKPFVLLNDQVTIIHQSLTTALLAQVDKVLNWPESNLFCCDTGSIRGQPIFFPFCFFTSFETQDIYLKTNCV